MRKSKISISLMIILGIYSKIAFSSTYGVGSSYDTRIQTVVYNESDVVNVRVRKGVASVVQVDKGEIVQDVALGDPMAWKVSVRENSVFFRPVVEDNPDTNVIIKTNKRTYAIYLTAVSKSPTYILRFMYPKPPKSAFIKKSYPCTNGGVINGHYQLLGSASIFPYQIWDDGEFTCMRWSGRQDLPLVSRIDSNGNEHLVNSHMDKNTMVIHDVSNGFVLRLGDQVVNVKTTSLVRRNWNSNGTSNGQKRTEIDDE